MRWLQSPIVRATLAAIVLPCACSEDATTATTGQGGAVSHASTSAATTTATTSIGTGFGGNVELPHTFTVTGVVTDGAAPVDGAIVMQAGGEPAMVTGSDGAYAIEITLDIPGIPTLVAAKVGYRTRGVEFDALPGGPVELAILRVPPPDNTLGYTYGPPGRGDARVDTSTRYCGHCHTALTAQFLTSSHSRATKDPIVQALYAGVSTHAAEASCVEAGGRWRLGRVPGSEGDAAMRCYLGSGVLPDLNPSCGGAARRACDDPALPAALRPTAFGGCADCHAAALDGPAGGRDLLEATGLAFENGNHCDTCHKVSDIDLRRPPGVAGALVLQRPRDRVSESPGAKLIPVMYGPYPDVPNEFMGGSYQPKFAISEFCAGCHEQKQRALLPGASLDPARWPDGLPIHETFSEWSGSRWNRPGTQCQSCHMPELEWLKSSVDVTDESNASISFGFLRPPGAIRSHIFRGPLEGAPRLIHDAVYLSLSAARQGGELAVTVRLRNALTGHAIPTGEPMRALVLTVSAEACGAPLAASSGMTVHDTGGALAEGRIGAGASLTGAELVWPAGAARARTGDVVRIVRPTGVYDDYTGIGRFADPALSPAEKGLEIHAPLGEAAVVSASGGALLLSRTLAAQAGDLVYLGAPLAAAQVDGQPSAALAGAAGYSFAKVLVDPAGARHVPQHRAVDIASDNRIAPEETTVTSHGFALPVGCASATVAATLLYRPIPLALAQERGLSASDYVVSSRRETVPLN